MGFNGDLYPTAGATSVLSTKGDIVRYNTERERYGIGSANQILQVKSNLPSWETVDLADTVLTTAGDVLYENSTPELARLAAGTQYNNLQMGASLPAWAASSTSVLTGTGDVLYSSGANTLARLAIGSTNDVLTVAGGVPTWSAPAGGGAWTFLEKFTNPSEQDFFSCELASDYVYADNEWLVVSLNATMTATASYPNQLGISYQVADTGTSYLTSDNFSVGTVVMNPVYLGYGGYFLAAKASSLIMPDSVTTGSGYTTISTDQVFNSTIWIGQNSQAIGTHKFIPMWYQTFIGVGGVYCQGIGYHEYTTIPTTLSAIRFMATQGTGYTEETNGMGINATCSFWKVANS